MLTLTRKVGERIFVGDDVVIVLKEIKHGAARIGVQAPPDVSISREEIHHKKVQSAARQNAE